MRMLIHPELTLDCGISSGTWMPRTIGEFLDEVSAIDNVSAKVLKLEDYVSRLHEEMKKIDVFKRELPLSVLLISDAIAMVKDELRRWKKSNTEPVLEEFIPMKDDEKSNKIGDAKEKDVNSRDKMNWMSSVQLWNSDNSPPPNTDQSIPSKPWDNNRNKKMKEEATNQPMKDDLLLHVKNRTSGRTFAPFNGCSNFPVMMFGKEVKDLQPALSLGTPEIKNSKEDINSCDLSPKPSYVRSASSSPVNSQSNLKAAVQQQTARKQRRCWSPELHRRFIGALQQLGGAQAATPKQIRELMQVDGLTNDEVKSHLQKYRLHTRKLPSAASTSATEPVLLGGLWLSQEQGGESSKTSNSQSGSPLDPLRSSRGTSTTCGDSTVEDEDDGKSETFL